MKPIIWIIALLSLLFGSNALCAETTGWKTWWEDPKGQSYKIVSRLKKQSTVIENLEENILLLHPDIKWVKQKNEKQGNSPTLDLKIAPIGRWNNLEIYDVYNLEFRTKQIIVKVSNNDYRIIYSLNPVSASEMPTPIPVTKITKIDGTPVLISKIQVYRSEHYEILAFFDADTKAPVIIDLVKSIENRAQESVKNKYKVFCETDINNMTCNCSLFDANAERLGDEFYKGKLRGMIGFRNDKIVLKNIKVEAN